MSELCCYRCGASLTTLSLPLSRLDECPSCTVYLHCCRMCCFFDPTVVEQCTEDDAEEVKDKKQSNFCDYFKPSDNVFDPTLQAGEEQARSKLDTLFGTANGGEHGDADEQGGTAPSSDAEDLFR